MKAAAPTNGIQAPASMSEVLHAAAKRLKPGNIADVGNTALKMVETALFLRKWQILLLLELRFGLPQLCLHFTDITPWRVCKQHSKSRMHRNLTLIHTASPTSQDIVTDAKLPIDRSRFLSSGHEWLPVG